MTTPMHREPATDGATRWSRIVQLHDTDAEEAWRWFIDRYRGEILAMLRRRLPADAAAEAEAEFWGYLYVSRAVMRADRARRFRAYLGGVVRNFTRAWRRRHGGPRGHDELPAGFPTSAETTLEQEELRAWARHTVRLALAAMATDHPTQTCVLRWFYGLPDDDGRQAELPVATIAARLGKNIAAVHQDLTRGRLRLRDRIAAELREQSGSAADWVEEVQLVFAAIDADRPGLIPR